MVATTSSVVEILNQNSREIRAKPVLFRVNGIGFMFSGTALRHPDLGHDLFVRMHWFTVVFVPILPLGIYLLSHPVDDRGRERGGQYYIHRTISIRGVNEIWGGPAFFGMLVSGWLITAGIVLAIGVVVAIFSMLQH